MTHQAFSGDYGQEASVPTELTAETATKLEWFYSTTDDLFYGECATREEAIAAGRDYHDDGEPFEIGEGCFHGVWEELFRDWHHLAEFIDDHNEDASFEEGFCEEAGLGRAEIEPLLRDLTSVWKTFIATHKPVSRKLSFRKGTREDIPGTDEWTASQAKGDPR